LQEDQVKQARADLANLTAAIKIFEAGSSTPLEDKPHGKNRASKEGGNGDDLAAAIIMGGLGLV
jgi:hypothetical protein